MRIKVRVTPNSKSNAMERLEDGTYRIKVTAKPDRGKANEAAISLLSKYFHVKKQNIIIISGALSRDKVVEIA
ncbi:MAG: DUF167 domain-containing protein [Candidatus Micrarchaeaceae archaeon]